MTKPRILVLGEKPQGATWLSMALQSDLFEVVAGVPRYSDKNVWWDGEFFEAILRANSIPVIKRKQVLEYDYDILWSMMYGYIIEAELIEQAKFGLNLHESPLPRYRGCNGYSHSILENDSTYGTTLQFLHPILDQGDIIDQEIFAIHPDETAKDLYVRTMSVSNEIFRRNLKQIATLDIRGHTMDTESEPIRKRSSLMELKEIPAEESGDVEAIYRRVRALDFLPFEPVYIDTEKGRYYLFVNASTARFDHREEGKTVTSFSSLFELVGQDLAVLMVTPRPMVWMHEPLYAARYPMLRPTYSWVKT